MSKYDDLVKKLKEIFQLDKPELDFGIYRILSSKLNEINNYLEHDLREAVLSSISSVADVELDALKKELQEKERQYINDGIDLNSVPRIQELRQRIGLERAGGDYENQVYSHLLNFFSRYYQGGDFISQRRYKGDSYSIPYSGEEVMFYWANRDQFYTKSSENFSNYSFKLDDHKSVQFRLISADTVKDNRNDNDRERKFSLINQTIFKYVDERGEEFDEEVEPIDVVKDGKNSTLVIRFEYKSFDAKVKQEDLTSEAAIRISSSEIIKDGWSELLKREPTESNPKRTLLEKCLANYVSKNTADYFIHKNLRNFLNRELNFYIKNEMLNIDDLSNLSKVTGEENIFLVIRAFKMIANDLIAFLSQLEDFQKKIWVKKKFVISSEYLITLDKIPEFLMSEVLKNELQIAQWKTLGVYPNNQTLIMGEIDLTSPDFKKLPLMVDTSFFGHEFKQKVLAEIDNLEEEIDGLLVQGDNFQALNLISERYSQAVDFIYIDPPYNTVHSKIIYKNQFEHSSWLSLISNTLPLTTKLVKEQFSFGFAIDDYEYNNAYQLLAQHFDNCDISTIVVNHHPQGSGGRLSRTHEYYIVVSPKGGAQYLGRPKEDGVEDRSYMRSGTGENNFRTGRWRSFYALLVDEKTGNVVGVEPPPGLGESYDTDITEAGLKRIYPINASGEERVWRSSYLTGVERVKAGEIFITERGAVKQKIFHEDKREILFSNWIGSDFNAGSNGTAVLDAFGLGGSFDYPKSVKTLEQSFWMQSFGNKNYLALDYFAGSGTTGHATINLNRQDGGRRKFILIEQGEYFDSVTVPRIQKAVYSNSWDSGHPLRNDDGVSTIFKVLRLESYEDALNNIDLVKSESQASLLSTNESALTKDYLLNYCLNTEAKGSLLSVSDFSKPFDYQLNITADSAGAYSLKKIDLVETFNYLIGLQVRHIDSEIESGFVSVSGLMPNGEKTLVIWRDVTKLGYEALSDRLGKLNINPSDSEFDIVYINGDHNIPSSFMTLESEGGITKTLKVRQIEPEFLALMFSEGVI